MSMERKQSSNKKRPLLHSSQISIIITPTSQKQKQHHPKKTFPSYITNPSPMKINQTSDLPASILIDIFSRLPITTLTNCRYVCKQWNNLLTEPYFHKLFSYHMSTALILNIKGSSLSFLKQIYMIQPGCGTSNNSTSLMRKVRFVNDKKDSSSSSDDSFTFQLGNWCNGLVFVRQVSTRDPVLIWNPLMGQFVLVPKPVNVGEVGFDKVVTGFGYCGRTCRYKVVCIYSMNRVEIFEFGVGGNKWRGIGNSQFPIPSLIPGFYNNNSIHWILDNSSGLDNNNNNPELLCCFDFIDEKFKLVSPPPIYSQKNLTKYNWSNLGVIGGCLSICAIDAKIFRADVQIWVMEEYGVSESWRMRFSIRDPTVNWWDTHRWIQVTNIGKDGEIVLLCAHSYLLSYNVKERRFRNIEELKFPAVAVAPSFVSLEDVLSEEPRSGTSNVRYLYNHE